MAFTSNEETDQNGLSVDDRMVSKTRRKEGESKKMSRKEKRQKILQTASNYLGFFALGTTFSVLGPTLLDLERQTKSNTAQISFIFTARSIGGLVGAILGGILINRLNYWFLLAGVLFLNAVGYATAPYVNQIGLLSALFSIYGCGGSFYDAGGNLVLLKIWKEENGPWMQALHCVFGIGALVGPLIAEPFLPPRAVAASTADTATADTATVVPVVSTDVVYVSVSGVLNFSKSLVSNDEALKYSPLNATTLAENSTIDTVQLEEIFEAKSKWAYLIVGSIAFIAAVLLCSVGLFCSDLKIRCRNRPREIDKEEEEGEKKKESEETNRSFRIQLVILVFLFYLTYCILEMNFGNYITAFTVKELNWSEKEGARVTSSYWFALTAGRAVGILIVKFIAPWVMLTGNLTLSVSSLAVMLFFSHAHDLVVWVTTVSLGLGLSTIFATGITWTEQYISLEGGIGAVFMCAGAGGEMVAPLIIGILFEKLGPGIFLYVMFIAVCCQALLFVVMLCRATRYGMRKQYKSHSRKQQKSHTSSAANEDHHEETEEFVA